jgi:pyridoxine/pyridoxamine 5'-phosphate oxidase
MTEKIFNDLKNELKIGLTEKNHPFKLATLATVGLDKMARLRTVVVRQLSDDLNITFYTDKRSKKVTHIIENNKVSMLFYHPEKRIQLKMEGLATIVKNLEILEQHWAKLSENAKKDYSTDKAPGSSIKQNDKVEYLNDTHHFCMINIELRKIEYLKLNTDQHTRIRYSLNNGIWTSEFLVP